MNTTVGVFPLNCTGNCSTSSIRSDDEYDTADRAEYILGRPNYAIALILGVVGIAANTVSIVAITKLRSSLTSYLYVVVSLLVSDLLVACSVLAHVATTVVLPPLRPGYGDWTPRVVSRCAFMTVKALNTMGLNSILLNLMAMAVNHYVAILLPFRLTKYLSVHRTLLILAGVWILAAITGFSDFFSPLGELKEYREWRHKFNYCEFIWLTRYQEEFLTFFLAATCFLSMLAIYLRIYCNIRNKSSRDITEKASNKKALLTTLLILGSFIVCWLPLCTFNLVLLIVTRVDVHKIEPFIPYLRSIEEYLYDLVLLNTLCDPLIYAIRLKEVRRGFGLLFCSPSAASLELSPGGYQTHKRESINSTVSAVSSLSSYVCKQRGRSRSSVDEIKLHTLFETEKLIYEK